MAPRPTAPANSPWWSRFLSRGTYPGMPFDLRREVYLLNGSVWVLLVATTCLFFLWLFVRRGPGIWLGVVVEAVGISVLWLISRRRYQTAAILLIGALIFPTLYQSYFFQSGSHVYLLTFIAATVFLVRNPLWRRCLAAVMVAGYVAVQAAQMTPRLPGAVLPARYLINMGLAGIFIYGLCSLFREVNDEYRRRLDERNRELQEANAAREKIFSILAHDLRSPIAALKGGLDFLDDGTITQAELAAMKDDLKSGVDSVYSSLESLLEWSAGQMKAIRPSPSRVDLGAAMADVTRLLERTAGAKGIALENRVPAGAVACVDLHQVHAIFRNLVSNAVKFTPSGGLVEVGAASERPGWWRVTVRDNGVGMGPEQAARLFDAGRLESTPGTADEKGLGLGLQICRDFVRAHGGEITVESTPGKGTVFRFSLPAWRDEVSIPKDGPNC